MDGTVAGTKHVLALQRGSEALISGSQLEEDLPLDIKAVIFSARLSVCVCACVSVCMVHGACTHKCAAVHAHADGGSQASSNTLHFVLLSQGLSLNLELHLFSLV